MSEVSVSVSSDSQSGVAIHVAPEVVGIQDINGTIANGVEGSHTELDSYHDGRTTPTPESESANFLSRNSSFPSASLPESNSASDAPNIAVAASAPASAPAPERNTQLAPRAIVGLGPLQGEEQLKTSLTTNDRIFLLVVAKEVEAFMYKVRSGEMPNIIPSIPVATSSTSALASMSASFIVGSHVSSTFQRMLVYKLAEWYGLKAVHVPEVAMIIGVVGSYDTRGLSLRLADLAPREDAPAPAPKIKIMQRSQQPSSAGSASNSSRPGSVVPEDSTSEAGSSRVKTLEERAEAYAKARQRIYGHIDDPDPEPEPPAPVPVSTLVNGRQGQTTMDDFETVSRDPAQRVMEVSYPPYTHAGYTQYGYSHGHGNGQQQVPMPYGYNQAIHPQMNQPTGHQGYVNQNPQTQYNMAGPSYMGPMYGHQPSIPAPSQSNPYAAPGQWVPIQQLNYHQMPPNNGIPMQWVPHPGGQMQTIQHQHQPMPPIPQGMQYPAYSSGYPPQQQHQGNYGYLAQPTPTRPAPHPHSSASSSISSRSYHSYHDASRPHSRGSTTSNMSATSSVRFGSLYPANQGGGTYRQTRRKHHGNGNGVNGNGNGNGHRNGPIGEGQSGDSRETRDHSPGSASTNGSSHSSRRAGSISLIPPSQHPLPQRPDWAANNIPYHPSPIPPRTNTGQEHSPTDFPPLRHGTETYAEPMQVERAKLRPLNLGSAPSSGSGTAWNGNGNGSRPLGVTSPTSDHLVVSPRNSTAVPAVVSGSATVPTVPMSSTPTTTTEQSPLSVNSPMVETSFTQADIVSPIPPPVQAQTHAKQPKPSTGESIKPTSATTAQEEDFPRRPPPSAPQALYNPSAPSHSQSRPQSTKPPIEEMVLVPGKIPSEVIEAKLAAISLKEGVVIGPPVVKMNGKPASYAKIVRRD